MALVTAISSYQAARWDGLSSTEYVTSSKLRAQSSEAQLSANQTLIYNASNLNTWLQVKTAGDAKLAAILTKRFTPAYKVAFDAWLELNPLTNPVAPAGPAYMPQYKDPLTMQASNLAAQSTAAYNRGAADRSNGDGYVRVTVTLAAVLFLLAVGQRFHFRAVRMAMTGVAGVFLLYCLVLLITYPHA